MLKLSLLLGVAVATENHVSEIAVSNSHKKHTASNGKHGASHAKHGASHGKHKKSGKHGKHFSTIEHVPPMLVRFLKQVQIQVQIQVNNTKIHVDNMM